MNTKSFFTLAVASALSLLPISPAKGQAVPIDAITDISRTPAPITITWDDFGSSPYEYTVEHTDNLTETGPWTLVPSASSPWTDPDDLSTVDTRFYRVWEGEVGVDDHTYPVGFVKVEAYNWSLAPTGLNMISVPLLPSSPVSTVPDMRLADPTLDYTVAILRIGDTIAQPLPAAGSPIDFIVKWNPVAQTYEHAILYEWTPAGVPVRVWWDHSPPGTPSGMELPLRDGFWLYRPNNQPPPVATIVFLGWVPTKSPIRLTFRKGLTMFNWPYPTELKLNHPLCTLKDVGQRGTSVAAADVVYGWHPLTSSYTSAFLLGGAGVPPALEGKWFDNSAGKESDMEFKPGGAMWYLRRPDLEAYWDCRIPYSL